MSLAGASTLSSNILDLKPASTAIEGGMQFAKVIGDYLANVQGGPTGSPGILTYNSAVFGALVASMPPAGDGSWAPLMAANWLTGLMASVITPATVSDPTWTASVQDILTLPTAAATIITAPVAMATLASKLADVDYKNAAKPIAGAFHSAALEMQFLCIGLALVGPVPTPTPIPKGAQ